MKIELDLTDAEAWGLWGYILAGQAHIKYLEPPKLHRATQQAADRAVEKYGNAVGLTGPVSTRK